MTHLVITDNAAGTERYVAQLAASQAADGWDVAVIGGAAEFMQAQLPAAVRWSPGGSVSRATRAMLRLGRRDVVHSHLTNADLLAVLLQPYHRGRVVSTRHIAKPRGGSPVVRVLARVLQPRIAQEIAISRFVADAIGVPSVVVHNGVPVRKDVAQRGTRRVILAQRLEQEKDTLVALKAWRAAGLAELGWRLSVFGDGTQAGMLKAWCANHAVAGIEWRGWSSSLESELLAADALLATAPAEPLGLSVLEAMSVGLPAIVAGGGGHLETAALVEPALVFRPGDADDCARVLRRVAQGDVPAAEALRAWQRAHHEQRQAGRAVTALYCVD